jgi:hypothetical protein
LLNVNNPQTKVLLEVMEQRGYTLGRNLHTTREGAGGEQSKIPELLQDFKASGIDAIVTIGYPTALLPRLPALPRSSFPVPAIPLQLGWSIVWLARAAT